MNILHKRSGISGVVPNTTELVFGELALNTIDGKVFMKKGGNAASEIVEVGKPSELEKITENGNTGWRLLGRNPDNYGDIGQDAIDFSYSNSTGISGATGYYSAAFGYITTANGYASHAEGSYTTASGHNSHAEGCGTTSSGYTSHAEGYYTTASGQYSTAAGYYSIASGKGATTFGYRTSAGGEYSLAIGFQTESRNPYSAAMGSNTIATEDNQLVIGRYNLSRTGSLFLVGNGNQGGSVGNDSNAFEVYMDGKVIAPGLTNTLINDINTSEKVLITREYFNRNKGNLLQVGVGYGIPEVQQEFDAGYRTTPLGGSAIDFSQNDHNTQDSGATGDYSFAIGYNTIASGQYSHAEGRGTKAQNDYMLATGTYNVGTASDTILEVGIGLNNSGSILRKNALEIYNDGRIVAPELTTTLITSARSLVTKEYVDGISINSLNDIGDVNVLRVSDNQILSWNDANSEWIAVDPGSITSSTFIGLTDTPSDYSAAAGYTVKVNAAGDGLEFVDASNIDGGTF